MIPRAKAPNMMLSMDFVAIYISIISHIQLGIMS
jgi:hypothetical protein